MSNEINTHLLKVTNSEYGKHYQQHLMDQYQLYLEMTDRISQRRLKANTFFLSINSFLATVIGYLLGSKNPPITAVISFLIGAILTYLWFRIVNSYQQLNSGKFKVILEIEKLLPLSPYSAEWKILGEGKCKNLYTPFSNIEKWVPRLLMSLHIIGLIITVINYLKY